MAKIDWRGGENDGGGAIILVRENDGGGGRIAGSYPFTPGELPGWDKSFGGEGLPVVHPTIADAVFPDDGWDPAIVIDDIALRFAGMACWKSDTFPEPPPEQSAVDPEKKFKDDLDAFIVARAALDNKVKDEIRYQVDDIITYFMKLSACSPDVRPKTYFLLVLSLRIASIVVRHYKRKFMRARPAQVMPWVDTVIPTPRHPAYPSGHAMQAYLMAHAMKVVAPQLETMAMSLADRIALNRVLAGVHFPADGEASRSVIGIVWDCLQTVDGITELVTAAKLEH